MPWQPGTVIAARRPGVARRLGRRRLAAPDPAPPARPPRRARLAGARRAPSSSSSSSATPTRRRGARRYRDLAPGQPLQRRLLAARHRARRAAAAPHPQRDGRAPACEVEDSKGECNLGQHEINFRYGPALQRRRRARRLQGGREGDRRAGGHGDHVHGQVRRARGQLVPHPPLAAPRRRLAAVRRRRACSSRFVAGQLAYAARADAASTRRTSTRTSATPTARSRRPRCAGATTTARARCASSAHGPSLRVENRVPGADVNPYLAIAAMIAAGLHGDRRRARARAAVRGQRVRGRRAAVPRTLRDARDLFAASDVARDGVRRRGRRPLPQLRRRGARRVRRRGHRLGALPRLRAAVGATAVSRSIDFRPRDIGSRAQTFLRRRDEWP